MARRLRAHRAYRAVRPLVPAPLRDVGYRLLTRRRPPSPPLAFGEAATRTLLDVIVPDLVLLRRCIGEDFHCWGLLDGTTADGRR